MSESSVARNSSGSAWEGFDGPPLDNDSASERVAAFLRHLPECAPRFLSQTRGIVYTIGGGADSLTEVWVSLSLLRQTGCDLPVQVCYRNKSDMAPVVQGLLESLGAECVNLGETLRDSPIRDENPTALKLYSFLHSPFREALLLDSDTIPLDNPVRLFDSPEFSGAGALFWPDSGDTSGDTRAASAAGDAPDTDGTDVTIEAGQILLDKDRCWKAANLATWYAVHSGFLKTFDLRHQDSIPLAFQEADAAYWLCPWLPDSLEDALIHYDPAGDPCFQHGKRWTFAGPNTAGFTMRAAESLLLVDELREAWDGYTGDARRYRSRDASPERAAIADGLIYATFEYNRHGYDSRPITLLAEGMVGAGQGGRELYWDVYGPDVETGEWLFELANDQMVTCRLALQPDGTWQGHWLTNEKMPVTLSAIRDPVAPGDPRFLAVALPSCLERGTLLTALEWLETHRQDAGDTATPRRLRFASASDGWSRRDSTGRFDDGITSGLAWYAAHSGTDLDILIPPGFDLFVVRRGIGDFGGTGRYVTGDDTLFSDSAGPLDLLYANPGSGDSAFVSVVEIASGLAAQQHPPAILMYRLAGRRRSADDDAADPILQFAQTHGYKPISRTSSLAVFAWTNGEDLPNLPYIAGTGDITPAATIAAQQSRARQFWTSESNIRMVTHDGGEFQGIRDSNVLIYWPHGFGDWVFLSYILPLFEPSNRYFITRFGDDTVSLFEDCKYVTPLYSGHAPPLGDGKGVQVQSHFGLTYPPSQGLSRLEMPLSLFQACRENDVSVVLWSSNPETHGLRGAPYHTKARNLISGLVSPQRLPKIDINRSLPSCIDFTPPSWLLRWIESRLTNLCGFGQRKLCLIARQGFTAFSKNWGHLWRDEMPEGRQFEGQECREFMQMMLRKDPNWMFLVMEDRKFTGEHTVCDPAWNAYSYATLFGEIQSVSLPYGLVMKSLIHLASLCVGVPTGPYHLSMASGTVPTVGIWLSHVPSWYDEPNPISRHIIGRHVHERGFWNRPGSFEDQGAFHYDCIHSPERNAQASLVLAAVEDLL